MKIIDNKKDYYDHLSGVWGIDPLAVYDRRGSIPYSQYRDRFFLFNDTARRGSDVPLSPRQQRLGRVAGRHYLCLEAGRRQFILKVERESVKEDPDKVRLTRTLLGVRDVERKHAQTPLALFACDFLYLFPDALSRPDSVRYWREKDWFFRAWGDTEPLVENPILEGSFIVPLIPAEDIWQPLYEYILSLNEKDITDDRPDALKAESAGFDVKTSFRNVKD